jgi:hypothetical protein
MGDVTEEQVMLSVMFGEMSIDEGLAWGRRHGRPFDRTPPESITAYKSAAWSIEQAIGWIAWRTVDGGARVAVLLRYWGSTLLAATAEDGQRESVGDAKAALWNALIDGATVATGLSVQPTKTPARQLVRDSIPALDFIDLEWTTSGLSRSILQRDLRWTEIRLPASKVQTLWPATAAAPLPGTSTEKLKDRGGPSTQFDEVDFIIEAFRVIYEGSSLPASQADLNRRATEAYATSKGLPPGKPSLEWGKEKVRRLWTALELERPKRSR